jgi:hypothetical protein
VASVAIGRVMSAVNGSHGRECAERRLGVIEHYIADHASSAVAERFVAALVKRALKLEIDFEQAGRKRVLDSFVSLG